MVKQLLVLSILLAIFWLILSGYFTPFLISLALVSIALVLSLSHHLGLDDKNLLSPTLYRRLPKYWLWLLGKMVKSNLFVIKNIWKPRLTIQPEFRHVSSPYSPMVKVIQSNSITLTPGTVTVSVEEDKILVHALSNEALNELESGSMQRQLQSLEGE